MRRRSASAILRGRCGRAGRGWPGGILYDAAVDAGSGQVVEIPGGRWATRRAYCSRGPLCRIDTSTLSRRMPPEVSPSTCIPSATGSESPSSRAFPAFGRRPASCGGSCSGCCFVRPRVAAGNRAGRASANPCRAVGPASAASARRYTGAVRSFSESSASGERNSSRKSPDCISARVCVESVWKAALAGRIRSTSVPFRMAMLSRAMRAS